MGKVKAYLIFKSMKTEITILHTVDDSWKQDTFFNKKTKLKTTG